MQSDQPTFTRFVRLGRPVQVDYGISRSTQYRLINSGKLRPPRKITSQLQGWLREELEQDLFAENQQELANHN